MATTTAARQGKKAKIKMATARKTVGAKNEKQTMGGPNSGKSENERHPTQEKNKKEKGRQQ